MPVNFLKLVQTFLQNKCIEINNRIPFKSIGIVILGLTLASIILGLIGWGYLWVYLTLGGEIAYDEILIPNHILLYYIFNGILLVLTIAMMLLGGVLLLGLLAAILDLVAAVLKQLRSWVLWIKANWLIAKLMEGQDERYYVEIELASKRGFMYCKFEKDVIQRIIKDTVAYPIDFWIDYTNKEPLFQVLERYFTTTEFIDIPQVKKLFREISLMKGYKIKKISIKKANKELLQTLINRGNH